MKTIRIRAALAYLLAFALFCAAAGGAAAEGAGTEEDAYVIWGVAVGPEDTELSTEEGGWVTPAEINTLLENRPKLKKINIFNKKVKLTDMEKIIDPHPEVDFGLTIQLNRSHILRTDMTAYSTLGRQPQIGGPQTKYFAYLKQLKALDIGHMNVHSVEFLRDCPKLKILIIADCALRDIDAVSTQTELEYLEVFKNYITDLTPLSGLTKLKDLNIGYNKITDFSPLYGLQNLERLWLMGNWFVEDEEIERLREHLPNCDIVVRSYGATGNLMDEKMVQTPGTSWRHHPHYDTIHWIFNHNEYIDWDVEVPQVKTPANP